MGIGLGLTMACKDGENTVKENSEEISTQATVSQEIEAAIDLPGHMVEGEKVYTQHCLLCHQSNGAGVPGLNPPLNGTEYVVGDKDRLLEIVLYGSNVGLLVNGSVYSNAMPAFKMLGDEDIANVTSYIRNSFGNAADPITADEVVAIRSKIKE